MPKFHLLLFFGLLSTRGLFSQHTYFPPENSNDWETLHPTELNYCADSITALYDYLEIEQTKAFILLKDGRVVLENYFGTYQQDSLWFWASAGKSLRGTLVGIAQEQGLLSIDQPTSDLLGAGWSSLSQEQEMAISIWHQLTMTSGLDPTDFDCTDPSCLTFFRTPGNFWVYHNSPYNLLKEVLEVASGLTLNQLTNRWVRNRIGMQSGFWLSLGNNTIYFSRARDMARFGLLIQSKGQWAGETILGDTSYIQAMLTPSQDLNPGYGYLWWLNGQRSYISPGSIQSIEGWLAPSGPVDLVVAAGSQGQFISISPAEGLVMIRQGSGQDDLAALAFHDEIWRRLSNLSCDVVAVEAPTITPLRVYPNPSSAEVFIANLPIVTDQAKLVDVLGRSYSLDIQGGHIDVSMLPSGLYQLVVQEQNRRWLGKIVVR